MSNPGNASNPAPTAPSCVAPLLTHPESGSEWFLKEVHPHGPQLRAWLNGKFPEVRHEVDDVVQESFLRLWKRNAIRPIASAKSFLFRSAQNLALDFLRRKRRSPFATASSLDISGVIDDGATPSQALTHDELAEIFAAALDALPAKCCQVVIMHKLQGRSQKEVAAALGISVRTVEFHIQKGLKLCESFLRAHGVSSLLP
ncbi:MAG: sigma-70 family RNA polymerase sigma factor [Opitutaceae bacterium]|nr:sigma-70 family RNA polymerase sigma factor [Opitutaceae bacterium]